MTDERWIEESIVSGTFLSPDEKILAVVLKKADIQKNSYVFSLILYEVGSWNPILSEYTIEQPQIWWLSEQTLLVKQKQGYTQLAINSREENLFDSPAKIDKVILTGAQKTLFILEESIPQDEDFYTTQSLPFLADGKGYIQSFRSLWQHNHVSKEWKRLVPENFHIKDVLLKGEDVYFTGYERQIERVDFLHSGLYRLTSKNGLDEIQTLIPDGEYRIDTIQAVGEDIILAASDMKQYGQNQNPYFYCLNHENKLRLINKNEASATHTVVRDWKGTTQKFVHAKDGIWFLSTVRGDVCIKKITLDGKITEVIHENGVIDDFAVFSDGSVLTVGAHDHQLDELYWYHNGKRQQISNFHHDFYQEFNPVRASEYFFKTNNQVIDYFVMPPQSLEENKKYPAIVSIHGGHKMAYGKDVLIMDFQLWAERGYFVIFCNPRGSDGQDNDFANIIGKNAVVDTKDILNSLDLAIKQYPQIDEKRIGLIGGSYGGYLTNWLITQTNRFACAVSIRSISNRISKQMGSDTGFRYPLVSIDNRVWADTKEFWKASPLAYADRCQTPTLFIHAEGDFRCPVSEAIQMYTALKLNAVQAKLILFKGESHALAVSGKPRARLKHSREIRNWFSNYLNI
ncbi:alpha/beta hydrolase family protein [Scatolibacter rhodanostii]|uniref:alpha/beta hydrolase family protein n=1 Tax=Scatolibacter rhodanostii TaxID=2014781 RepID=UPI000C07F79C|nr:prolyl oligopeptidase family serine peptidase [Scatolibacter rhodanostii]